MEEIATLVSERLEQAGISAVLSGGAAVSHYSENEYLSNDLDFVTIERNKKIAPVVEKLGFIQEGKNFFHPNSDYFIEFPSGPLAFGNEYIDSSKTSLLKTTFGQVRIITPTQCIMDRLAWFAHGKDLQAKDQAIMVAKRQRIKWKELYEWAKNEGIAESIIDEIKIFARSRKA